MIQSNVDLQPLNTLAVPSTADYFVECDKLEVLSDALSWANKRGLTVHVLGEGSNVLLANHVDGLVIHPTFMGISVCRETDTSVDIAVGAGVRWHELVCWSVEQGYSGLENLALIPGNVGAAPIQNIGAYGVELKDVFVSLAAMAVATQEIKDFEAADCEFAYRESIFKRALHGKYVITQVVLRLQKNFLPNLEYGPLKNLSDELGEEITAERVFNRVCEIRKAKLPDPNVIPNAGSFFKNPVLAQDVAENLKKSYPDMPQFVSELGVKVPAAWLIEQRKWKQVKQDGVGVHVQQALVLCNPNKRPLAEVLEMAEKIQQDVLKAYGIALEVEPQRLC